MIITKYNNGNTVVTISNDGTKIREYNGQPKPIYPESLDVKITNYCDNYCLYCHENSNILGSHANLARLTEILSVLPRGTEIAIGGGNPLMHPGLVKFLTDMKGMGYICNITINQDHIETYWHSLIKDIIVNNLVRGIGVSVTNAGNYVLDSLEKWSKNIVYHLILGVHNINILDDLITSPSTKILLLGFKRLGRGKSYYNTHAIEENIKQWYMYLPKYLGKCILSFDNLAIEQLNVKRLLTEQGWNDFYMGNDFEFSMYIDAVMQEFGQTSTCDERTSFNKISLVDFFQKDKL